MCVSPETNQLICLLIDQANDGIIDCLGAQDEPTRCQATLNETYFRSFYCKYSDYLWCARPNMICDNRQDCLNNEDEQACKSDDYLTVSIMHGICTQNYELYGSDAIKILCRHFIHNGERWRIYFTLDQRLKENSTDIFIDPSVKQKIEYYQPRCHRGLDLQIWLDKEKNLTTNICLCPTKLLW